MNIKRLIERLRNVNSLWTFTWALNNARKELAKKNFHKSIEHCDNAIEVIPRLTNFRDEVKAEVYHQRAWGYYKLQKFEKGIQDCDKSIELDPNKGEYYNFRGVLKLKSGAFPLDESDFHKTLELNPDHYFAYYNLGRIQKKKDNYDSALLFLNKAIQIKPNILEAYFMRLFIYVKLGKDKEWRQDSITIKQICDKKVKRNSKELEKTYLIRAIIYFLESNFQSAKKDLVKVLDIDGHLFNPLMFMLEKRYPEIHELLTSIEVKNLQQAIEVIINSSE